MKNQCPRCKKKTFIVSIFGSICSNCFYDPKDTKNAFEEFCKTQGINFVDVTPKQNE